MLPASKKWIFEFDEIDKEDVGLAGGKGANLGEMVQAGFPIPPGFIVSAEAYRYFIETNDLQKQIKSLLKVLNRENSRELQAVSGKIKRLILHGKIPDELASEIIKKYHALGSIFREPLVVVRSSATAEGTSLNVKGDANVVEAVKRCWASLFTPRAIFYREEKGAVIVQEMIQSEVSGVAFTSDPLEQDKHKKVPKIKELAKILQKIHSHYYFPQEVEWAYKKGKFYIIQSRPITTLGAIEKKLGAVAPQITNDRTIEARADIKTATKIYVNLAEPELAEKVSKLPVDGVGLLRAEFMLAQIGVHPKHAIAQGRQFEFIDKLAADLGEFCINFDPRPVVYRATDFKTNEYRNLDGGKDYEPEEPNPMLGYRGAYRYVADPDVFELELAAIKKVREEFKNLWMMLPFVRSPEELLQVKRIMTASGLVRSPTFKLWLMVELPVNVILLEQFIAAGIDGVSVGSNDLTMLILGTDRDNSEVAQAYNERSPAILWALERVVKTCRKHNITSSICGQTPSSYDNLVEYLVRLGISSISVNPDAVGRVQKVIYDQERRLANGKNL